MSSRESNQFQLKPDTDSSLRVGMTQPNDDGAGEPEQSLNAMSIEDKERLITEFDLKTIVGTGTFGRVLMVRSASLSMCFALKVMSIVEIIKRKQTQHVKNEKVTNEPSPMFVSDDFNP